MVQSPLISVDLLELILYQLLILCTIWCRLIIH